MCDKMMQEKAFKVRIDDMLDNISQFCHLQWYNSHQYVSWWLNNAPSWGTGLLY